MKHHLIKVILLSIILGSLAGVFSGSLVYTYLFSYMDIGEAMIGAKDNTIVPQNRLIDEETQKIILSSLVTFYRAKERSNSVINDIYLDSDRLGYGFAITSDGWVVTDENILTRDLSKIVAMVGDKDIFSIKKIERDDKNGKVFVRLDASNLNPIAFGDSHELIQGEPLYVIDNLGNTDKVFFNGLEYNPLTSRLGAINSSEELDKKLRFSGDIDETLRGAPLVNYRGEVVGIVTGDNNAEPFQHIFWSMQSLFRNGKVSKLFLGINYIDLAHTRTVNVELPKRGALVISNGNTEGVIKNSPAWYAGIEEGDIILSVGKDELNEDYSLSERISEYRTGDVVDFKILRNGEEIKIGVEFVEL